MSKKRPEFSPWNLRKLTNIYATKKILPNFVRWKYPPAYADPLLRSSPRTARNIPRTFGAVAQRRRGGGKVCWFAAPRHRSPLAPSSPPDPPSPPSRRISRCLPEIEMMQTHEPKKEACFMLEYFPLLNVQPIVVMLHLSSKNPTLFSLPEYMPLVIYLHWYTSGFFSRFAHNSCAHFWPNCVFTFLFCVLLRVKIAKPQQ